MFFYFILGVSSREKKEAGSFPRSIARFNFDRIQTSKEKQRKRDARAPRSPSSSRNQLGKLSSIDVPAIDRLGGGEEWKNGRAERRECGSALHSAPGRSESARWSLTVSQKLTNDIATRARRSTRVRTVADSDIASIGRNRYH